MRVMRVMCFQSPEKNTLLRTVLNYTYKSLAIDKTITHMTRIYLKP